MRALILSVLATPLAASCTTPAAEPPTPPAVVGGKCDATAVQGHVGHDATAGMGEAILKESGARTLRWGPPNSVWTMDYREDRVNVRYDEAMKITEITCG